MNLLNNFIQRIKIRFADKIKPSLQMTENRLTNDVGENGFIEYSEQEIEKWDKEWLNYLLKEYLYQLASYNTYPDKPPLPDRPADLLNLTLGWGPPLHLYCHREAMEGKHLMEMGCGCGNLGKLISRYCDTYLGVDCSRVALAVAKLVSPANCTYLHVNQHDELKEFLEKIDTVVSRFFWIHQNMEMARRVLSFLEPFLKIKGRIYMDLFWPNPEKAVGFWKETWLILSPYDPLSEAPSAVYQYALEDIEKLLKGYSFKIVCHELHGETQRRYVVIEKQD